MMEGEPFYLFRCCLQALKEHICKPLDKFVTTLPDSRRSSTEEIQTKCSEQLPAVIQTIRKNCRHIHRLWQVTLQLHCTLMFAQFEDCLSIGWEDAASHLLETITSNIKQYSSMPYFSAIKLLEEELNAFIHASLPLPVILDGVETYLEIQNVRKEAEAAHLHTDDDHGGRYDVDDDDEMKEDDNTHTSEPTPELCMSFDDNEYKAQLQSPVSTPVVVPKSEEITMAPRTTDTLLRTAASELGAMHPRKRSYRPITLSSTRSDYYPTRDGFSRGYASPPKSPSPQSFTPTSAESSLPQHSSKSTLVIPEKIATVPQKEKAQLPVVRTETLTEKALYQHTQNNPPKPKLLTNPVRNPQPPSEKPEATAAAGTRRKLSLSSLSSEVSSETSEISC
jgi:hypothetical protein